MSANGILASLRLLAKTERQHKSESVALWSRFGRALRAERRARDIPRSRFAEQLGYTPTMLNYLESGKRRWPMTKAELAVKLLTRRAQWPH